MPLVAYGHAGYPLLMFPTAAADFLEYERVYLIDAITCSAANRGMSSGAIT